MQHEVFNVSLTIEILVQVFIECIQTWQYITTNKGLLIRTAHANITFGLNSEARAQVISQVKLKHEVKSSVLDARS